MVNILSVNMTIKSDTNDIAIVVCPSPNWTFRVLILVVFIILQVGLGWLLWSLDLSGNLFFLVWLALMQALCMFHFMLLLWNICGSEKIFIEDGWLKRVRSVCTLVYKEKYSLSSITKLHIKVEPIRFTRNGYMMCQAGWVKGSVRFLSNGDAVTLGMGLSKVQAKRVIEHINMSLYAQD